MITVLLSRTVRPVFLQSVLGQCRSIFVYRLPRRSEGGRLSERRDRGAGSGGEDTGDDRKDELRNQVTKRFTQDSYCEVLIDSISRFLRELKNPTPGYYT